MRSERPTRFPAELRRGFTLIELVVVVLLIALLTSLAVVSLAGAANQYRLSSAVEVFERFELQARRDARRADQPLRVTIDRTRGRLTIGREARAYARFQIPAGIELERVRLRRRAVASGSVTFEIGRNGQSPSYAVQLRRGDRQRWLVVLGVSGQVIELEQESDVDAILSL